MIIELIQHYKILNLNLNQKQNEFEKNLNGKSNVMHFPPQ